MYQMVCLNYCQIKMSKEIVALYTAINKTNLVRVNLLLNAGANTNPIMIKGNGEHSELYQIHKAYQNIIQIQMTNYI